MTLAMQGGYRRSLPNSRPAAPQDAQAHRPRHRLRHRQDRRPRRQGPDRALGRAHQGLRRRPDAAASAPAQARLQEHDVRAQAQRSESRPHPGGDRCRPARCRRQDRRGGAGQGRRSCAGPRTACGCSATARSRPRSRFRCTARRNRRWRRWKRPAAASKSSPPSGEAGEQAGRDPLYRRPGRRPTWHTRSTGRMVSAAEQLAANLNFGALAKAEELKKRIWFTLGALLVYRLGTYIPLPGIDPTAWDQIFNHPGRRHSRHVQHVRRRRHSPHGDLRAEHHALHLGLDHHPADDDGVADARAAQEGGRAGPQDHQSVHALSDGGAGRVPGLRHRHRP